MSPAFTRSRSVAVMSAALVVNSFVASAQCGPSVTPAFPSNAAGGDGSIIRSCVYDDGRGEALFVAGDLRNTAGEVGGTFLRFDGTRFTAISPALAGIGDTQVVVRAMAVFDADGDGPQRPRLYIAGDFTRAGTLTASRIAAWDGVSWSAVGEGSTQRPATITDLKVWDADGPGPQGAALYASGYNTNSQGISTGIVSRWDGQVWGAQGSTTPAQFRSDSIQSLAVLDDLSTGRPRLVAVGAFSQIASTQARNIAGFDGSTWSQLGGGFVGTSDATAVFDPDGGGPVRPILVMAGLFSTPSADVISWDGASFAPMDANLIQSTPLSLAQFDADGDGPQPASLYIGGVLRLATGYARYLARWDGTAWRPVGSQQTNGFHPAVYAMTPFDPDGSGPIPPVLCCTGTDLVYSGGVYPPVTFFAGSQVIVPRSAPENVRHTACYDPDGPGPIPQRLYAIASMPSLAAPEGTCLCEWDGSRWRSLAPATGISSNTLVSFDFDGEGPELPVLVAAGSFPQPDGTTATLARFDVAGWVGFATTDGSIAACEAPPPGHGGPGVLVIAGSFTRVNGVAVSNVAVLRSGVWSDAGPGLSGSVYAAELKMVDEDGAGPAPPTLFMRGSFSINGDSRSNRLARFDGAAWSDLRGDWMTFYPYHIERLDEDGDGPEGGVLCAAGSFFRPGGTLGYSSDVLAYRSGAWVSMRAGSDSPDLLAAIDPDGAGPLPQTLVIGSTEPEPPNYYVGFLEIRGSDGNWSRLGPRLTKAGGHAYVRHVAPIDEDGAGPRDPAFMVFGEFEMAGLTGANAVARWGCGAHTPLVVVREPDDLFASTGREAVLVCAAAGPPGCEMSVAWRKDGGAIADSARVQGANTPTLRIIDARVEDEGSYDAVITTACDAVVTRAAEVRVRCPADFNSNGAVDGADVAAFFDVWDTGETLADVSVDGGVDGLDIEIFFRLWEAGGC